MSYTSFDYSNLVLSSPTLKPGGTLTVTADIKNSGARDGAEIVQLYIQDVTASVTQPVRRLVDFKRVELRAGETQGVTFKLPASKLGFHNEKGEYVVEPGAFRLWVSRSSADDTLAGKFSLVKAGK